MSIVSKILEAEGRELTFSLIEIGALPLEGNPERFHPLVSLWPGSQLHAFEVDPALCERLNREAKPGFRFHPRAIGGQNGPRTFHDTVHPMCGSLYPPDERWADMFHNLDVMRLKGTSTLETVTLDTFAAEVALPRVDFIKMDIQGAELEALSGGMRVLEDTLLVVCEVDFVPLYVGQPLYGDVERFMRERGFQLHKFVGLNGRAAKPVVFQGNLNFPTQHMWSDAIFVRDLFRLEALSDAQLLRLAVLLEAYGSPDVGMVMLREHDRRHGTTFAPTYLDTLVVRSAAKS